MRFLEQPKRLEEPMKTKTLLGLCAVLALFAFNPIRLLAGPGSALSLDGVNDYVDLPDAEWFGGDFTIEMWVNTGSISADTPLVQFGNLDARDSIVLALERRANTLDLVLTVGSGSSTTKTLATQFPGAGEWTHVAAVVQGSTGYLYLNGLQVGWSYGGMLPPPAILRTNNYLGRSKLGSAPESFAQAMIDEVRIWSVGRNPVELQDGMHRELTGAEDGLVAYWRFNEGGGATATDATTNHLDGTLVNGPLWIQSGVPFAPDVETLPATDIALFSAILTATVTPNDTNSGASGYFEWGTTTNYGNATTAFYLGPVYESIPVSKWISGLQPLTTYHFRCVANNPHGTTYGTNVIFTTLAKTNAELSNLVLASGNGQLTLVPSFAPSLTNYTSAVDSLVSTISVTATGLDVDETLQVRLEGGALVPLTSGWPSDPLPLNVGTNLVEVLATAQDGLTTGNYRVAVTRAAPPLPPYATTLPATSITSTSAVLNGTANANGTDSSAVIRWSLSPSDYHYNAGWTNLGSGTNDVFVSGAIGGILTGPLLQPATTYYYRLTVSSSAGYTTLGGDMTFTTLAAAPAAPLVGTYEPTSVTASNAVFRGVVNPNGASTVAWFEWGATTSYGMSTLATNVGNGANLLGVSTLVTNLTAGTVYHYRLAASNSFGLVRSYDLACPVPRPLFSLDPPEYFSGTNAMLKAIVTPNGWPLVAWFEWGPSWNIYQNKTPGMSFPAAINSIPLTSFITGLVPGQTYSCRLVASNSAFVIYSDLLYFIAPVPAGVTTLPASAVSTYSATLNGRVNPMAWPTKAWFQWGPTTNYGYTSSPVDAGGSAGDVPLSLDIDSLFSFTTYHFRLVATNAWGSARGQDFTFTTPSGSDTPHGIFVTPTLLSQTGSRITATFVGGKFYPGSTPPHFQVRLVASDGQPVNLLEPVSISPTKLVFDSPPLAPGYYGYLVRTQANSGVWFTALESSPRFFKVDAELLLVMTSPYHVYEREYPLLHQDTWEFLDTTNITVTGSITGQVTVAQYVNDGEDVLNLGLKWDPPSWIPCGEGRLYLKLDFILEGNATFSFSIPFEITYSFPKTVYPGQLISFNARSFRFPGGDTLQVDHNHPFSTDQYLYLNVPCDTLAAAEIDLYQKPDGLVVSGAVPILPYAGPETFGPTPIGWPFDDGCVTGDEIELPDAYLRLGGYASWLNTFTDGGSIESSADIYRRVSSGTTQAQDLWSTAADQISILARTPIPYVSTAAGLLDTLGKVDLIHELGLDVVSTDSIQLKPPYLYDLRVDAKTNS